MLARSTSTSTDTSELRYCLDYSSQHVFAARLELEVRVYQSIISELTRCTMNFRSISRIISTPQKIRGTECLSSPAPKAHEAMKQLFAFFKDSEKGMSTDGMKRSIAKSFIDTGTVATTMASSRSSTTRERSQKSSWNCDFINPVLYVTICYPI